MVNVGVAQFEVVASIPTPVTRKTTKTLGIAKKKITNSSIPVYQMPKKPNIKPTVLNSKLSKLVKHVNMMRPSISTGMIKPTIRHTISVKDPTIKLKQKKISDLSLTNFTSAPKVELMKLKIKTVQSPVKKEI